MFEDDTVLSFFVATKYSNKEQARQVMEALANSETGNAMVCAFDWTQDNGEDFENRKQQIAMADFDGAMEADVMIILMPIVAGAYTELGIALANGAFVILWAEKEEDFLCSAGYENIYFNHENVQRMICPFGDFITRLKSVGLTDFEI